MIKKIWLFVWQQLNIKWLLMFYRVSVMLLYLMISIGCQQELIHRNCDEEPTWSPDGRYIAFYRDPNQDPPVPFGEEDSSGIWILDLETMEINFFVKGSLPDWSPDGKAIVYVDNREIYKIDVETNVIKKLATEGFFPDWSPDGNSIVFSINAGDSAGLYIIDSTDNNMHSVGEWGWLEPDWHPTGNTLAFIGHVDSVGGVYAVDTNGYNVRLIVEGGYSPIFLYTPVFSPDGLKVAYVSEREGERNIYVIDTLGQNEIQLTDVECAIDPFWSPDGSQIVFSQQDEEAMVTSLWIMNSDGSGKKRITWTDD